MLFIFDLDHTLIDSSHRQLTREDGTLDLDHWRENCTPEKIMCDQLLPLAKQVREIIKRAPSHVAIIACTARVMGDADFRFLKNNGLHFDTILSRPEGNKEPDYKLKEGLLRNYALQRRVQFARLMRTAVFYDDNDDVRKVFTGYGTRCYNPIEFNTRYAA